MSEKSVLVMTGVGGVVGHHLITKLQKEDKYEIRILSRNPEIVRANIADGNILIASYDQQKRIISGSDTVIHLAARNNDLLGSADDFDRDNCELTKGLANTAKKLGVRHFIFSTSTKALNAKQDDIYGHSKFKAELELASLGDDDFRVSFLRLCPVYGHGTRGKLKYVKNLPFGLNKIALSIIRSFTPIVSANKVAQFTVGLIDSKDPLEELCISDTMGRGSLYFLFANLLNFAFIIAVPTLLLIPVIISAIAVPLTSPGGILFIQPRVGTKQKVFSCRKFRTMREGTPIKGTHEVGKSYVTKVGAFLRKFKLDELPQATNVLFREMNLIGPRPCLETQTELRRQRERYGVFDIRPGITGLGQCAGVDMSEPLKLSIFDHRYKAFRSVMLDVKIVLSTVLGKGFGDPVDSIKKANG